MKPTDFGGALTHEVDICGHVKNVSTTNKSNVAI